MEDKRRGRQLDRWTYDGKERKVLETRERSAVGDDMKGRTEERLGTEETREKAGEQEWKGTLGKKQRWGWKGRLE